MIKRFFVLLLVLAFALPIFCGCRRQTDTPSADAEITVPATDEAEVTGQPAESAAATEESTEEPTEAPTDEPTPEPTEKSTFAPVPTAEGTPVVTQSATAAPTAAPTQKPTAAPTQKPTDAPTQRPTDAPGGNTDYAVFSDCAFIGNSIFDGLYRYAIITNSHFFTKTGLNINTVYTATTSTGSVPIINELYNGSYKAVLLMFGQNELGWPSLDTFVNKYAQLLQDIWQRQPHCKIFITGLPPVTKAVSDTNTNGLTNDRINYLNGRLQNLANNTANAYYLTVPAVMYDSNGALPAAASGGDGIHLNRTYYKYWADHICRSVSAVIG